MKRLILVVLCCILALTLCQVRFSSNKLYSIERKSRSRNHALTMDREGRVSTEKWRNRRAQMWQFIPINGKYSIVNAESGRPLSIRTGLVLRRQRDVFSVTPEGDGYYKITDDRGRALAGTWRGNVRLRAARRGSDNQLWKITEVPQ